MKNLKSNNIKRKKNFITCRFKCSSLVNGIITEKSRIDAIQLTVKKLQEQQNKIFLISHYGRPKGEIIKRVFIRIYLSYFKK